MSLSKKFKPVWKAISSILHLSDDLANIFLGSDDFADIINNILADDIKIDEPSIKSAFYAGDESEYSLPLNLLGVGHDGDDIIYIYKSKQFDFNGARITAIGRFRSFDDARSKAVVRVSVRK